MAINAKIGADLTAFNQNIKQGQTILKGLNAEMKATDAEFKATGNSEQYLANKTKTLNSQLQVQKGIADQAKKALKEMDDAGIKPTDAAYQKLYVQMMQATAGMNETQAALNALSSGEQEAAKSADQLTQSVQSIGKKMSLEQVINGINTITGGLETAAKKAIQLGENIWNSVMDSAKWADDTATMAQMYGIDLDTFQRMQKLVTNGMDTTVEAMIKSQQKLTKNIGDGSKNAMEALQNLHIGMRKGVLEDWTSWENRNPDEMFWEVGNAIMNMKDAFEQESAAQALFGRSWHELVPLFSTYKNAEEYNKALADVNVNSEDTINDLVALNDKMGELKGNFETLKTEVLGELAPALTGVADSLNGVLDSVLAYLKTDDGKALLKSLGDSISGMFRDLSKIDPKQVTEGFTYVFNSVVGSLQWLVENKDTVIGVLEGVAIGWGALEITGGALKLLQLVQGIRGLTGAGAAAAAGEAGAAAGTSFATGFVNAFVSVAPVLASILGVTAVAIAPAVGVMNEVKKKWGEDYERRMEAAGNAGENETLIRTAAEALGKDGQVDFGTVEDVLMGLKDRKNQQKAELYNLLSGSTTAGSSTWNVLNAFWNGAELDPTTVNELVQDITDLMADNPKKPQVPVELELPEDVNGKVSEEVGTVAIKTTLAVTGISFGGRGTGTGGGGAADYLIEQMGMARAFANGIRYVSQDNTLALLHKGERVTPAREVNSRNYNSNLYVENMIMGGGTDARGLADEMAAAQRRQASGYGS